MPLNKIIMYNIDESKHNQTKSKKSLSNTERSSNHPSKPSKILELIEAATASVQSKIPKQIITSNRKSS